MAVVGTNVTAANYNTIQGKINDVLGAGDGAQNGYGQAIQSSQKSAGDVIAAQDMQQLYNDLITARLHQTNPITWSNADGLAAPSATENVGANAADIGDETPITTNNIVGSTEYMIVDLGDTDFTLIGASANEVGLKFTATGSGVGTGIVKLSPTSANAEDDLAEGYLDFEAAADEIVADINQHDADNFTISTVTSTRTNPWGGGDFASPGSKIINEVELTWLNSNERRYFFNTGGEIRFTGDLTGAVTASSKEDNWNTVLANMGTVTFSKNATTADGSSPGSGTAIGNYYADWNLTNASNRAVIYLKNGSGLYADIQYRIEAWEVAAGDATTPSTLRFRIEFQDNDYSSSPSDVDEYIDNDIESSVKVYHDTVLGIPAPSITTITALDDGVQNAVSANLTRTPATGTINEGASVTFTLSVNPSENGTTIAYNLSGTGITVSDLDGGAATNGVFTLNNGIGSITITAKNDQTSEGAETLICSVPSLSLQQSIQINDTSTAPTPPPPPETYNLTGPNSLNEGSQGAFNLATSDNDQTFYYTISPAGVMTSNSGNFSVVSGGGSFNLTAANDATVGDNETITISIRLNSISGTVVTSKNISIVDTTIPPRTENLYAIDYYALQDTAQGVSGPNNFASYGKIQTYTKVVSSSATSLPQLSNVTETRYYGGWDTGYTWTKDADDNRIDISVIGGGGGGMGVSVDSTRGGPASGGGSAGTAIKTLLDGNIPNTASIIVGRGGDGSIQESGSNDFNQGRNGGISTFSYNSTISKYTFTPNNQSFVMQGFNIPSVWVWEGRVIRTQSGDTQSSFVYNGVTYQRGPREAIHNYTIGPGETETIFYYRIERAGGVIDANPGTKGGAGLGGLGGSASGGDSNFAGVTALNTSGSFNILQASTGATTNTGDGIQANLPDGDTLAQTGSLADANVGNRIKEGGRTNISPTKPLLDFIEIQGGTAAVQSTSQGTYCNGLGPGAGGGGMSQRQAFSRGGAGHPGVVAIARYSSTKSARQFQTYTANGLIGESVGSNVVNWSRGYVNGSYGSNTTNFSTTTGSHALDAVIMSKSYVSPGFSAPYMGGLRFAVIVRLTGNVPFDRVHSIDVSQGSNRAITFIKTQTTVRSYNGSTTSFIFDTLDGLPPIITSDEANNEIWTVGSTYNLVLRTWE